MFTMGFPIKVCSICGEQFELRPEKPGFANRCWDCSASDEVDPLTNEPVDIFERKTQSEVNEARRSAIRDLLYRKDS